MSADEGTLQLEIVEQRGLNVIRGELCKVKYKMPYQPLPYNGNNNTKKYTIRKIPVWKDNGILLLEPSKIIYIKLVNKKATVHTTDNIYESNSSLEELERRLSNMEFYRCHRSYIVNMEYVDRIIPWFNSTYNIKLKTVAEQIPVSRHYAVILKNLLSM